MAAKKPSPTPSRTKPTAAAAATAQKTKEAKSATPKAAAKVAPKPAAKPAAKMAAKPTAKMAAKVAAKPAAKVAAKPAAKVAEAKTTQRPLRKEAPSAVSRTTSNARTGTNGHKTPPPKGKPLSASELKKFRKLLLELRERLVGDIKFLTTDNLHRAGRETGADLSGASQHSADHGTDNFDREFALSLATTEQDVLFEVDEALRRIEDGSYGVCELTGVQIERARLEVIPYTRLSVQAQARMEASKAKYRPFGQTFKAW